METILTNLPSSLENERVLIVLIQMANEVSHLELRQQSFGEGIGWFTQSSVRLEPSQVAALKNSLGVTSRANSPLPKQFGQLPVASWQPRLVTADSA